MVSPASDTRDQIEERLRYRKAAEQAHQDTLTIYPVLTAENAAEAIRYQERRIKELLETEIST